VNRIDDRSRLKDRDRQSGLDRADRHEIGVPLPIGSPFVLPMAPSSSEIVARIQVLSFCQQTARAV
jgi:hypothetical protein